jgi:hypothetical protein
VIRRAAVLLLLALQIATSASPAAALIICLSNDGCAALEVALPGTTRCDDRTCNEPHAGAAEHSCRDIPVLSPAQQLARGTSTADQLCTGVGIRPALSARSTPPHAVAVVDPVIAPIALRQLRSIVLTL